MSIAQRSMRISNLRNRFFMLYLWTLSLARSTATKRIKKGKGKESHLFWHIVFPITDYFSNKSKSSCITAHVFPSIVARGDDRHYLHCKRATRRGKRRTSKLKSTQRDKTTLQKRSVHCSFRAEDALLFYQVKRPALVDSVWTPRLLLTIIIYSSIKNIL